MAPEAPEQHLLLALVDLHHLFQQLGAHFLAAQGVGEAHHVAAETGAAETAAGVQIGFADARVGTDALAHRVDVHVELLRQQRHVVHIAEPGGEHATDRQLGEFRFAQAHHADHIAAPVERAQDLAHQGFRLGVVAAQQDMVRAQEAVDRHAFLQGLRQRHHPRRAARLGEPSLQGLAGAHREHALVDQQAAGAGAGQPVGDLPGQRLGAGLQRQEHRRRRRRAVQRHRLAAQPPGGTLLTEQLAEPRLAVRHPVLVDRVQHPALGDEPAHLMAALRQGGGGHGRTERIAEHIDSHG